MTMGMENFGRRRNVMNLDCEKAFILAKRTHPSGTCQTYILVMGSINYCNSFFLSYVDMYIMLFH